MTDPVRHIQTPTVTPPGNVSSPNIEETNSYDVDFSVRKLKHNMRESCGPFYVVFDSVEDASSFSIDYRINTADLPDDTEGSCTSWCRRDEYRTGHLSCLLFDIYWRIINSIMMRAFPGRIGVISGG